MYAYVLWETLNMQDPNLLDEICGTNAVKNAGLKNAGKTNCMCG